MKKRELRDHLRDHFQQQELPSASLAKMLAATAAADEAGAASSKSESRRPEFWSRRRMPALAFAVAAVLALVLIGNWAANPDAVVARDLGREIAREVAMNHAMQLEPDFAADHIENLGQHMDKLDFDLMEPGSLRDDGCVCLGGRYCSVKSNIAAQVKLQEPDGSVLTLYLTRPIANVAAGDYLVDGVSVRLWEEDGMLCCLARDLS